MALGNAIGLAFTPFGGGLLPRNTDIVEAAGYQDIVSSGTNLSGHATGRYFLNRNNLNRVRQEGIITKVLFYINTYIALQPYYFQVWRVINGLYTIVYEENIVSQLTGAATNTVILSNPCNVREGDMLSVGQDNAATSTMFIGVAVSTANSLRWEDGVKQDDEFNWNASSGAGLFNIPIKAHMQAPLAVVVGDSIAAGHPDNFSFIEDRADDNKTNSISYQLNALTADLLAQNMGVGSQTTANIVSRFVADVVDLKPRYAIINGGVNDIANGSVSKSTFIANWTTILNHCSSNNIIPVVMKVMPWSNGTNLQMQTRDDWMADLQVLVNSYAGSIWVDFDGAMGVFRSGGDAGNLWDIQTIYDDDGVHPNGPGYMKVAATIAATLGIAREGTTYYVRPSGGSYGTEDGSSYANAWDGFANIDWTATGVQPGDTLFICGTHTEKLNVSGSGTAGSPIYIRGDFANDPGIIDGGGSLVDGIDIDSKDNITIDRLTVLDCTTAGFLVDGTSQNIICNNCYGADSYINYMVTSTGVLTCNSCDGVGDNYGMYCNGSATLTVNGGLITNVQRGIFSDESSVCSVNDVMFGRCSIFDLVCANAGGAAYTTMTVTDCVILGNVSIAEYGDFTAESCVFIGAFNVGALSNIPVINLTNCILNDYLPSLNTGTINSCLILSVGTYGGTTTFNDCFIPDNAATSATAVVVFNRCLFRGGASHIVDVASGGNAEFYYCAFNDINTNVWGIAFRAGSTGKVEGCTFTDTNGNGRGVYTDVNMTIDNCIFTGLNNGFYIAAGTAVANNCCFYNNVADSTGSFTNNSPITTDPLLTDAANNDYSLGVGSSCIGAGKTLTEATGIASANWGNGTDEVPEVTTKEQASSWDVGAYIS